MSKLTAIDADGHVIERESEIRKHLKARPHPDADGVRVDDVDDLLLARHHEVLQVTADSRVRV